MITAGALVVLLALAAVAAVNARIAAVEDEVWDQIEMSIRQEQGLK